MNKMSFLAPALIAAAILTACGGDEPAGTPPAAPVASGVVSAPSPLAQATAYTLADTAPAAGHCALDAINGASAQGVVLPASGSALFGGWVANAALEVPTDALFVLRGAASSHAAPLVAGGERPDVAQALASDALSRAGFNLQLSLDGIPPGRYELVAVVDPASQGFCTFNTTLVLE